MNLGFTLLRNSYKLSDCISVCIYNCMCPPGYLVSLCLLAKIYNSGAISSGLSGAEPVSAKLFSFFILSSTFMEHYLLSLLRN